MCSIRWVAACHLALVCWVGIAGAATNGNLGATSTGTTVVSITVPDMARVSDLNDFTFTVGVPYVTVTAADNVCAYINTSNRQYTVKPTSSNAGATTLFRLRSGTNYIPYGVGWTRISGSTFAASTCSAAGPCTGSGITSVRQGGASNNSLSCADMGGSSATLSVQILAASMSASPPGIYTDTLTLLVTPD